MISENDSKVAQLAQLDNIERGEQDITEHSQLPSFQKGISLSVISPKSLMSKAMSSNLLSSPRPDPEALNIYLQELVHNFERIKEDLDCEEEIQASLHNKLEVLTRDKVYQFSSKRSE